MENELRDFKIILKQAGAKMGPACFGMPPTGLSDSSYYDRLYVQELYHRLKMEANHLRPYTLCGIHEGIDPSTGMPHFNVHTRDQARRRIVVIDIKPAVTSRQALKSSVIMLDRFITEHKYYRGMLLIYGNGHLDPPPELIEKAKRLLKRFNEKILLIWHRGPGVEPIRV